jgi:ubiquinone/menaquinone biosynthesis C-methylase UbiE
MVATIRNVLHATRLFSHSPARELADDPFAQRARGVWTAGDYDRVSRGFRHEAEVFVDRLGLTPADNVLDAACGTGNLTIPAARTGAQVTGLDLVPTLLESTANRAYREGLDISLDEGTVERLPYDKGEFNVVMSMFGVMFAARPDRVVAELRRVTRPGGRVALANWTPDSFVGRMLAMHAAYVPPPADAPSPLLWGDESVIHRRFDSDNWNVKTRVRTLTFRYPYTPGGTAKLFRTSYGPTVRVFESLDNEQRELLAAELLDHWTKHQRPGKRITEVDSNYLEVVAIRR